MSAKSHVVLGVRFVEHCRLPPVKIQRGARPAAMRKLCRSVRSLDQRQVWAVRASWVDLSEGLHYSIPESRHNRYVASKTFSPELQGRYWPIGAIVTAFLRLLHIFQQTLLQYLSNKY